MDNTLTFSRLADFIAAVALLTRENIAFTGTQTTPDRFTITITGY